MVEVREFHDVSARELVSAWEALEGTGACPGLFSSRIWVSAWSRHFAAGSTPSLLVGYDGDAPIGLAPLFVTESGTAELPVNFLSLRSEFLFVDGRGREFVEAALRHLRHSGRELVLRNLPSDSPSHAALAERSRPAGYLCSDRVSRVTPYVDTSSAWDDYVAGLPKKRVVRWQRRVRKLERQEGMRIVRYGEHADVGGFVDGMIDVDSRSWREAEGTSIRGRGLEEFYGDSCGALAGAGWFKPYWVEHDGRMVAFVLGVVHSNAYYALKTGYDESYSKLSPGICLFYDVVRDAFAGALSRIDFLGEPARWKSEWATGQREHVNVRLYPSGVVGFVKHVSHSLVRPLAKRALQRE